VVFCLRYWFDFLVITTSGGGGGGGTQKKIKKKGSPKGGKTLTLFVWFCLGLVFCFA